MPKGGRVKVKKIISKDAEADVGALNEMFEQMTGSKNADIEILIPKINKLHSLLHKFVKVYDVFLKFDLFRKKFTEYEDEFTKIEKFVSEIKYFLETDLNLSVEFLKTVSKEELNDLYDKIRNNKEIKNIIVTSSKLKPHKKHLADINDLTDGFIKKEPGFNFTPLAFSNIDIKLIWYSDKVNNIIKKYILTVLSHTFTIGFEIYEIITSPNIDIKKFSKIIVENIEKLKKIVPRCDKAFNMIKNSVDMLENNFKGYYKSSIESENPSVIIENFILDVSNNNKANASVTAQFRKIIMHMKKQATNHKDPRVKKLFNILNSQFDLMAEKTGIDPVSDNKSGDEETENVDDKNDDGGETENVDDKNDDGEETENVDDENNNDGTDEENMEIDEEKKKELDSMIDCLSSVIENTSICEDMETAD